MRRSGVDGRHDVLESREVRPRSRWAPTPCESGADADGDARISTLLSAWRGGGGRAGGRAGVDWSTTEPECRCRPMAWPSSPIAWRALLEPGCSLATTTPMSAVARWRRGRRPGSACATRDVGLSRSRECSAGWGMAWCMGNLFSSGTPPSHHPGFDPVARPAVDLLGHCAARPRPGIGRPPLRSPGARARRHREDDVPGQHRTRTRRRRRPRLHPHARAHLRAEPRDREDRRRVGRGGEQARAVAKLRELKQHGIDTLVDLTVDRFGPLHPAGRGDRGAGARDQRRGGHRRLHLQRGPDVLPLPGPGTVLGGAEPMVDLFVREIEEGIGDTGVRAGILKCASDRPGITPGVERVLARRGPGPPGHRRADHDPHADAARAVGPRAAAHLHRGRASTSPGS